MACVSHSPLLSTSGELSAKHSVKHSSRACAGVFGRTNFRTRTAISPKISFKTTFELPVQFNKSCFKQNRLRVNCEANGADQENEKIPFGYTRKDVILIGVGILVFGLVIKYGLEFLGVDPLQAGNVVQLFFVLGLMVAWVVTYIFRVGNKEMTYVKQLKDYEDAVMQKRLEELPEAELEAMLAEVEEEKLRIKMKREKKEKSQ